MARVISATAAAFCVMTECCGHDVAGVQRIGNAGRNILRSDGINNIDFGLLKNTRIGENQRLQLRADFYNFTNSRDFGIPDSTVSSANFLNQWGTDGGNRRVVVGVRYVF